MTGLDNINLRLLRYAAPAVVGAIHGECNEQEAKVIAIHKDGPTCYPSNYKPISILSCCMKVFERAVHNQLNEYLTEHLILCKHQSGFRQNHSTITAIVDVTDFIFENMDKSLLTGIAYVDLRKAFGTVNPSVLLRKISWIGIKTLNDYGLNIFSPVDIN